MGLADLHIHSIYSWDGTATISAILNYTVTKTSLNVIAITDHDEIQGALYAEEIAPRYGIEVIPGSEVSTAEGHVLALFVRQRIPMGMSLIETVRYVGELGGLCIAAHPMANGSSSLSAASIQNALKHPDVAKILVGIEAINAGLLHQSSNLLATALAHSLPVAHVATSDSHILETIGFGMTEFEGTSAADLRRALQLRRTKAIAKRRATPALVIPAWVRYFLLKKAGWVQWTPQPHQPLRLGRTGFVI
ncbi:MAG: PHP domain-containing protein [Anaerolineales bacterium]|nr:PHP domain-containing protein [Anaerolineales bacterium]MDW8228077.1 PHP-associated domain-containing protein [Anaerolineales bacterium]